MQFTRYSKPRGGRMIRPAGRFLLACSDKATTGYVYAICEGESTRNPVKIGWAIDPMKRLATLQTGNPTWLEVAHVLPGDRTLEAAIHAALKCDRIRGEWFVGDATRAMAERFASAADSAMSWVRHSREMPPPGFFYDKLGLVDPSAAVVPEQEPPTPKPKWSPDPNYIVVGESAGPPPSGTREQIKYQRPAQIRRRTKRHH